MLVLIFAYLTGAFGVGKGENIQMPLKVIKPIICW
jgi:hypothetical protein